MAFVRGKKRNGRTYYYLVENRWDHGKVRQKVLRYLGAEKPSPKALKRILEEIKEEKNGH
ncbi:hypothetical protein ES703_107430 [subsurface metagenome]